MEQKLNLYQKLIQIRKEVPYAQKSGNGFDYQYATESQVLGAIRPKMDELGVFLETEIVSLESIECEMLGTRNNPSNKKVGGVRATFKFTWVNADCPEEKVSKTMVLQDAECDVQTVGGLMTYANRYFLYKSLSIPTDKEDPDTFENSRRRAIADIASKDTKIKYMTDAQVSEIAALCTPTRIAALCATYNAESLQKIEAKHFDFIISTCQRKQASL